MNRKHLAMCCCAVAASVVLAGGCNDGSNPAATGATAIPISAGAGTTPTYTWSGGPVFSVTVVRTSDSVTPVWSIVSPSTDGIASPLTHGTVPAGAVAGAMTENALTIGVEYRVSVGRFNGTDYGEVVFTP